MLCMSTFTFLFFTNTFLRFAKLILEDQNWGSRFLIFNVKVKVTLSISSHKVCHEDKLFSFLANYQLLKELKELQRTGQQSLLYRLEKMDLRWMHYM